MGQPPRFDTTSIRIEHFRGGATTPSPRLRHRQSVVVVPTLPRIARRAAQITAVSVEAVVVPISSVIAAILAAFSAALLAGSVDLILLALHILAVTIIPLVGAPEHAVERRLGACRRL
jgi:hypothetical protein